MPRGERVRIGDGRRAGAAAASGLLALLGLISVLGLLAPAGRAAPAAGVTGRLPSARPAAGQVYSFGGNLQGELGRPAPMNDPSPRSVPLPPAAGGGAAIAAGAGHSLVIGADGRLYAFGSNTYGQLGSAANVGSTTPNPTPAAITLPGATGRVTQAAGGEDVTLALTASGQLYSFGNNVRGELGRGIDDGGTDVPRPTPAQIVLPAPVRTMAAGEFQALAITTDDRLYAWGENNFGQLGIATAAGTELGVNGPVQVPLTHTGRFVALAAGGEHTLVLTSTGEVFSFGNDRYGQLGRPAGAAGFDASPALVRFPGLSGTIVAIAAGQAHSLALSSTGRLYSFGDNRSGRLGRAANDTTDTTNQTPAPVTLPAGAGSIVQIAAGARYSLALTAKGSVFGFGDNNYGPLGSARNNGTDTPNATPIAVVMPAGAKLGAMASSADSEHTLVLIAGAAAGVSELRVDRVSSAGAEATLTVTCTARAQPCAGTVTGTSRERLRSGRPIAVSAATHRSQKKTSTRTATVLRAHYAVAAGQTARVAVALNASGRRLLDRFYTLPVSLSTDGRHVARATRFRYAIIRAPIDYFWNFRPGYTFIGTLGARGLRRSWHVTLTCRGGGCPLSRVSVKIHGGRASATSVLQGAHLRPGAVVQLAVSGRDAVSEVLRFTMASGALPRTSALCQTPDQRTAGACYR